MDTGAALYVSLDADADSSSKGAKAKSGLVGRLLRLFGMKGH